MADTKLVICEKCWGTGHVNGGNENSTWSKTCEDCHGIGFFRVPMTNADRIRAMSDEELAKWIDWLFGRCEWCDTDKLATDECNDVECTSCILEWLKQPAE